MLQFSSTNRSKLGFLVILIVIVSLITYFRIKIQMDMGSVFDTFDYLADAAEFAGKGIGYTDLNRPPFISFLTAIFFLFSDLSVTPVFIVDGLLSIAGCIGLYLFFIERFNPVLSFLGGLLFATFPIVVTYTGAGFNDVSSIGVAIWAMYLTYLAAEKNSRWFYLSFPVSMLAFLTRFNMALLVFPIFLYIFINWDRIKNHRDILIGVGLSFLVIIPFLVYIGMKLGNPFYTFMDFFGTSGARVGGSVTEHFAYHPDSLYYLKNITSYIGAQSLVIVLFTLLGFFVYWTKKWKETRRGHKWLNINLTTKFYFKLGILIVLVLLFLISFARVHYFITEFIFFGMAYVVYDVSKDLGFKDWRMDLLFISWFMAIFIFHSVYVTKDHRYFVAMIAPISYFLIRAFEWAASQLKVDYKGKNLTLCLLALTITVLVLFFTLNQFTHIENDNERKKLFDQDAQQASLWLMSYDPQYKSKVIYADLWSYFAWYLKMDVNKMPIFKNNQTMYVGPKDYNFTKEDNAAFDQYLELKRPDYYISAWRNMNYTSYEPIAKFGTVTVFKRKE